ncbi:MAG TPA: M23 family metallopeptidase [Longimicrobiaceae bacterium]|nr:M23 family metallopeptidase [Longimicrobiaceae bacterium]
MIYESRFRRVAWAVVLAEVAAALGLAVYLAVTDKRLVLGFEVPGPEPAEEPGMIVPVAGVRVEELRDTYGAARSGGRTHEGLDILAPRGTPVLAAAAATVVRVDSNAVAGRAVYLRGTDGRTIHFYGHLDRFRAGLKAGDLLRQGDTLGYVGDSGNAPEGVYHLHFSVYTVTDPNRWWRGRPINPYTLLADSAR